MITDLAEIAINTTRDLKIYKNIFSTNEGNKYQETEEVDFGKPIEYSTLMNENHSWQTYHITFSLQRSDFECPVSSSRLLDYACASRQRKYGYTPVVQTLQQTPTQVKQVKTGKQVKAVSPSAQKAVHPVIESVEANPIDNKDITLRLYVFNSITVEYTLENTAVLIEEETE